MIFIVVIAIVAGPLAWIPVVLITVFILLGFLVLPRLRRSVREVMHRMSAIASMSGNCPGVRVSSWYTRRVTPAWLRNSSSRLAQCDDTCATVIGFASCGARVSHAAG